MTRRPRELDPSASVAAYFGSELRYHRVAAGYTQEELGQLINYTGALVCMVETCARPPSLDFARRCDAALNTGGALERLWPLVNRGYFPDWFRGYVDLESRASEIRNYEPQLVPGLLQIEGYARMLLSYLPARRTPEEVDEQVSARLGRQALLTTNTSPLLWFILDESILRRPIGTPELMRSQFSRILELSELPNVVVQVVPYSAGLYPGLDAALTLFSFADGPDIGYAEGHAGSTMLIHHPDEVAQCSLAFELTEAAALSPQRSADVIKAAMEGL